MLSVLLPRGTRLRVDAPWDSLPGLTGQEPRVGMANRLAPGWGVTGIRCHWKSLAFQGRIFSSRKRRMALILAVPATGSGQKVLLTSAGGGPEGGQRDAEQLVRTGRDSSFFVLKLPVTCKSVFKSHNRQVQHARLSDEVTAAFETVRGASRSHGSCLRRD